MARRLSLFAGSGGLVPLAVAAAQRAGFAIQVLAVTPRPDLAGVRVIPADIRNPLSILWSLKSFRTTHVLLAGAIDLSDRTREALAKFAGGEAGAPGGSMGDSSLSHLGVALEKMTGAALIGVHELAPDLLAEEGLIAGPAVDEADSRFALGVAREIGRLDIGQAVVTSGRRVIAVEDIAGTDAMLRRIAEFRTLGLTGDGSRPLILAKAAKPQQPLFADLPAIGLDTVDRASEAGIAAIAVEAGRTLIIDREHALSAAEAAGIGILGVTLPDG